MRRGGIQYLEASENMTSYIKQVYNKDFPSLSLTPATKFPTTTREDPKESSLEQQELLQPQIVVLKKDEP